MAATPKELAPFPAPSREMDPARLQFIPESPDDTELLVSWLTTDTWPFHGSPTLTEEKVREMLADREDASKDLRVWVTLDEAVRIGRIVIQDLEDLTAVANFRIRTPYRGRGIGLQMVRWAADRVFRDFPNVQRVEGQTRVDNYAMQRVFRRAGWQPEAYYRRSWPDPSGTFHDSIGYAILRPEWETGVKTPVPWPFDQWDGR
jgi:RimJ/RimL family protein N-acetyltransferase